MLGIIKVHIPAFTAFNEKMEKRTNWGIGSAFLLGILFALAFCPYSGVLYFGMLIPMTISNPSGLYLPIIFALATGLPVIIFSWFIAFSMGKIGTFYNKMKSFEMWFRRGVAVLFIGVGLYYTFILIL